MTADALRRLQALRGLTRTGHKMPAPSITLTIEETP